MVADEEDAAGMIPSWRVIKQNRELHIGLLCSLVEVL
jgi:hypothetical protein